MSINKYSYINKSLLLVFTFLNLCIATGNLNNFELGTAMYRELGLGQIEGFHWHAGVFCYFEYSNTDGKGILRYSENNGYFNQLHVNKKDYFIGTDISNIAILKSMFKDKFCDDGGLDYHGAYVSIR